MIKINKSDKWYENNSLIPDMKFFSNDDEDNIRTLRHQNQKDESVE